MQKKQFFELTHLPTKLLSNSPTHFFSNLPTYLISSSPTLSNSPTLQLTYSPTHVLSNPPTLHLTYSPTHLLSTSPTLTFSPTLSTFGGSTSSSLVYYLSYVGSGTFYRIEKSLLVVEYWDTFTKNLQKTAVCGTFCANLDCQTTD